MGKINNDRLWNGTDAISDGRLKGETYTNYFYLFCPVCKNRQILRLLDYKINVGQFGSPYNEGLKSVAIKEFTLALNVNCEKCGLNDFVKISNIGWQGGSLPFA